MNPIYAIVAHRLAVIEDALAEVKKVISDARREEDDWRKRNNRPDPAARPPRKVPQIIPLAELERRAIIAALNATQGKAEKAAKLLGIGKTAIYRKIKEYRADSNSAAS